MKRRGSFVPMIKKIKTRFKGEEKKMKGIKKLLTGILAATMIMGMSITTFAGENTTSLTSQQQGHLTITETNKGQEYKVYKVFDAVATADGTGFNYKLVTGKTRAPEGFTVDDAGNVFYTKNMNLEKGVNPETALTADDIAAIKAYVTDADIVGTVTENDEDGSVDFSLGYGYYYIETTTGVAVTINTNQPNAVIVDKNDIPTIEKTVEEDSAGYQKQNDAEIGQKVNFATQVNVKKGGLGYVLYDKMSEGLTFTQTDLDAIEVHVGSVDSTTKLNKGTDYTVAPGGDYKTSSDAAATTGTFTVTFSDTYTGALTEDKTLYVTYSATLNSSAQVNAKEINDTVLKYGNDGYTEEKETWTFTWGLKVVKVIKGTTTPLAGAKFALYKVEDNVAKFAVLDANNKVSSWVSAEGKKVADLVKENEAYFTGIGASVLTTPDNGTLNFNGLDADTYYALEVEAPAGYNKLTTAEQVIIDSTSDTDTGKTIAQAISAGEAGVFVKSVENGAGALLPSTGGIGTTIFYIVGGILIIAGVAYFIVRRKANSN